MHHSSTAVLVVAVFLASVVEMVEALTVVVAVGVTRGWRSALEGAAVALLALSGIVGAIGPAIVHYVPLPSLRLVVGGMLLVFGLQWLRKAVLRAAGLKAKHDEGAVFSEHVRMLGAGGAGRRRDTTAFAVACKAVLLEGLEVVVVVLTLGGSAHRIGLAAMVAAAAVLLVAGVGAAVARQLSSVPENAMKMGVGLMLVSFGTFWSGEGAGAHWPGSDLVIVILVAAYGAVAWLATRLLRVRPAEGDHAARAPTPRGLAAQPSGGFDAA